MHVINSHVAQNRDEWFNEIGTDNLLTCVIIMVCSAHV